MIGKLAVVGVFVALGICLITPTDGLTCLSCDGSSNITDCLSNSATCKDGEEECFLDRSVKADLTNVFTGGCRSSAVCKIISSATGKRSIEKRNVACAQCCATNPKNDTGIPCNGFLCNQKPIAPGKTCAICSRTGNFTTCSESQQCPQNDICQIKMVVAGGSLVYELGCEQKTQCDTTLKAYKESSDSNGGIGRRENGEIEICSACCDTRNCNKADCNVLRKNQPCNDPAICGP